MLQHQHEAFNEKFRREPGPDDPIMINPDADDSRPISIEELEAEAVAAMVPAGFDPGYIYAYQQTGLMPTEANRHLLPGDDLAEFDEAVARYRVLHVA